MGTLVLSDAKQPRGPVNSTWSPRLHSLAVVGVRCPAEELQSWSRMLTHGCCMGSMSSGAVAGAGLQLGLGWGWFWAAAPWASQVPSGQSNEPAAVAGAAFERWLSMAPAAAAVGAGVICSSFSNAPPWILCDPSWGICLQESKTSLLPPA